MLSQILLRKSSFYNFHIFSMEVFKQFFALSVFFEDFGSTAMMSMLTYEHVQKTYGLLAEICFFIDVLPDY